MMVVYVKQRRIESKTVLLSGVSHLVVHFVRLASAQLLVIMLTLLSTALPADVLLKL